jgi:hypothetical protein
LSKGMQGHSEHTQTSHECSPPQPAINFFFSLFSLNINIRGKGKGHPRTGHEGPEGEYRYSFTPSLTSALNGVGGQRHAPAALPPGKTQYP